MGNVKLSVDGIDVHLGKDVTALIDDEEVLELSDVLSVDLLFLVDAHADDGCHDNVADVGAPFGTNTEDCNRVSILSEYGGTAATDGEAEEHGHGDANFPELTALFKHGKVRRRSFVAILTCLAFDFALE